MPEQDHLQMVKTYYRHLTGSNELKRLTAAKAWCLWEAQCSTLQPDPNLENLYIESHHALAMASIEAHYFVNDGFIQENQILANAEVLGAIPITIIHGRYDMVCPVSQAVSLYNALEHARLHIVRDAGHSAFEAGITDNLIKATTEFAEQYT
ncbi:MAG: hypothetical protein ACPGPF_10170 [Pontibacterium sp.]